MAGTTEPVRDAPQKKWLSLRETAQTYGISYRTLIRGIDEGWFTEKNGLRHIGVHTYRVDPAIFEDNPPHRQRNTLNRTR